MVDTAESLGLPGEARNDDLQQGWWAMPYYR